MNNQDIKLATTYLWLQKAVNGGFCKCVEKENMNQKPKHFKKASFNNKTYQLTINFDDTTKIVTLPINYGIEIVEPEKNPDYKGYQRLGLWDTQNMYCFDAQY